MYKHSGRMWYAQIVTLKTIVCLMMYRHVSQFCNTCHTIWSLARIFFKTEDLKTTWRRKYLSGERPVVVDYTFWLFNRTCTFPSQQLDCQPFSSRKTSKGVNSNGISTKNQAGFTIKKSKGVSTVPKWESFMTIPESTSIVLNLTCQQYKRAVIQRLTLWYSLLALKLMWVPM